MDKDIIQSQDSEGKLDISYYRTAAFDIIEREREAFGVDHRQFTTNMLQAALTKCYHALFEAADKSAFPFQNAGVKYNTQAIKSLLSLYYEICEHYQALPSLYAFGRFTGIDEETVQQYVTAATTEAVKARKAAIQNKLYEAPVGVITLANNDIDSGLMYNRQNIADRETVKKALNFSELVKIAQKTTTAEDVSRDEGSNDDGGTV